MCYSMVVKSLVRLVVNVILVPFPVVTVLVVLVAECVVAVV